MLTYIRINLCAKEKNGIIDRGFARKEYDLPFAPFIGMEIETSAWKKGKEVVHVTCGMDDPCLDVYMGEEEFNSLDAFKEALNMYESHGWEVSKRD